MKRYTDARSRRGAVLRMLHFDGHRLLPYLLGNAGRTDDGTIGLQPLGSMKSKGSNPALNRMGADPKLLDQQLGAVPFFQVKL